VDKEGCFCLWILRRVREEEGERGAKFTDLVVVVEGLGLVGSKEDLGMAGLK